MKKCVQPRLGRMSAPKVPFMSTIPKSPGWDVHLVATAVGFVLICAAVGIGFLPVSGTYDSESFSCGSPVLGVQDDGGYGGTEVYEACDRERVHRRWFALGALVLGAVLIGAVILSGRRQPDEIPGPSRAP